METLGRSLNKGSHRTYDEIWHAYFAEQAVCDYVFPLCLFDAYDYAASIFNMSDRGGHAMLMAPLPFFNQDLQNDVPNAPANYMHFYQWLNTSTFVTDIEIDSDALPIYFSLIVCLRNQDTSLTISTPKHVLSHYLIWIGDTVSIEPIKITPGTALLVYRHNGKIRLNISIHHGTFMQGNHAVVLSKINNPNYNPADYYQQTILRFWYEFLKPFLHPAPNNLDNHAMLAPFYCGIIVHYASEHSENLFAESNVNHDLYISYNNQKWPLVQLSPDFLSQSLLALSPCIVPISSGWPFRESVVNRQTFSIYYLFNLPYSILYGSPKKHNPALLYGDPYADAHNLYEVRFVTHKVQIPQVDYNSNNSFNRKINLPLANDGFLESYQVRQIIDTGTSYTKIAYPHTYLASSLDMFDLGANSEECYIAYLYSLYRISNPTRLLPASHFILRGTPSSSSDYAQISLIRFYTGYPFICDVRVRSDTLGSPFRNNIAIQDEFAIYDNVVYPIGIYEDLLDHQQSYEA